MSQSYLSEIWEGLSWTPWYSFNQIMENKSLLPKSAGMYRFKVSGHQHLMYIGQTGRDLRERVTDLIRNTLREEMPFNDPHTAAPSLWAWKEAEGWDFECSVAEINLSKENREGLECYLLWKYRLEKGESTYCNHGRFHKDYIKSKARSSGFRGKKLSQSDPRNIAWGKSSPPLHSQGTPISGGFMGLKWSSFQGLEHLSSVPNNKGVYRIKGIDTNTIIYIGQSKKLKSRLRDHGKKDWKQEINYSYSEVPDAEDYHLKEIENDLVGGIYSINKTVPEFQFKNLKPKPTI